MVEEIAQLVAEETHTDYEERLHRHSTSRAENRNETSHAHQPTWRLRDEPGVALRFKRRRAQRGRRGKLAEQRVQAVRSDAVRKIARDDDRLGASNKHQEMLCCYCWVLHWTWNCNNLCLRVRSSVLPSFENYPHFTQDSTLTIF